MTLQMLDRLLQNNEIMKEVNFGLNRILEFIMNSPIQAISLKILTVIVVMKRDLMELKAADICEYLIKT